MSNKKFKKNKFFLRINSEVYYKKRVAICEDQKATMFSFVARVALRIVICFNNLYVTQDAENTIKLSSLALFEKFKAVSKCRL